YHYTHRYCKDHSTFPTCRCNFCTKINEGNVLCAQCLTAGYCSLDCMKKHFDQHKYYCNPKHRDLPFDNYMVPYNGPPSRSPLDQHGNREKSFEEKLKEQEWRRDLQRQFTHMLNHMWKGQQMPHCVICGDTEEEPGIILMRTRIGEVICNECRDIQCNEKFWEELEKVPEKDNKND
ncbi:MAG: zinc finger MYND domain-containing protein, partial [PVC group bacterium]|nr:zinc finger MYND domain-containing protein [PVC group bacterium]